MIMKVSNKGWFMWTKGGSFYTTIKVTTFRCVFSTYATSPPILINSLHPSNAIQLSLYINQLFNYDKEIQIQSCTLHLQLHLHNKYSVQDNHSVHLITLPVEQWTNQIVPFRWVGWTTVLCSIGAEITKENLKYPRVES